MASQNGHARVVAELLKDDRVDPAAHDNYAIRAAAKLGRDKVVQVLLSSDKVDPGADDNAAIRIAAHEGHLDTVRVLMSDPRVDPSAFDCEAVALAAKRDRQDIVQLLLQHPKCQLQDIKVGRVYFPSDPSAHDNFALRYAAFNGHLDTIDKFLADDRVNISGKDRIVPIIAAHAGHLEELERLIQDDRIRQVMESDPEMNKALSHESISEISDALTLIPIEGCGICMMPMLEHHKENGLTCSHQQNFHKECLKKWSQTAGTTIQCPYKCPQVTHTTASPSSLDQPGPSTSRPSHNEQIIQLMNIMVSSNDDVNAINRFLSENKIDFEKPLTLTINATLEHIDSLSIFDPQQVYSNAKQEQETSTSSAQRTKADLIYHSLPLALAIRLDQMNTFITLLAKTNIDVSADENYALSAAAYFGKTEMLKQLLKGKKKPVEPSAFENRALKLAIANGQIETARLLLNDTRINLTESDVEFAIYHQQEKLAFEILRKLENAKLSLELYRGSCKNGLKSGLVELLEQENLSSADWHTLVVDCLRVRSHMAEFLFNELPADDRLIQSLFISLSSFATPAAISQMVAASRTSISHGTVALAIAHASFSGNQAVKDYLEQSDGTDVAGLRRRSYSSSSRRLIKRSSSDISGQSEKAAFMSLHDIIPQVVPRGEIVEMDVQTGNNQISSFFIPSTILSTVSDDIHQYHKVFENLPIVLHIWAQNQPTASLKQERDEYEARIEFPLQHDDNVLIESEYQNLGAEEHSKISKSLFQLEKNVHRIGEAGDLFLRSCYHRDHQIRLAGPNAELWKINFNQQVAGVVAHLGKLHEYQSHVAQTVFTIIRRHTSV